MVNNDNERVLLEAMLIAEYLTENGYPADTSNISLNVGMECRGYGPNEQDICVFKDCTVKLGGRK